MEDPLDAVVWSSLTGAHARFGQRRGGARRYPPAMSPFGAIDPIGDDESWRALADLTGSGGRVLLAGLESLLDGMPSGWSVDLALPGVQLVETEALKPQADPEAVVLGPADHAEMAALVARTRPGPWGRRTPEFGRYLGIRCDGVLAAMAGERMRPAGWTEISAVCTDPAFRGQGLAGRLVRAVADGIRARGERSLLHAASGNPGAIRMYEGLGYAERRSMTFFALRRD